MNVTEADATGVEPPAEADAETETRHRGGRGSKLFQGSITFAAFLMVFLGYRIWLGGQFASTSARALDIHQNAPVLMLGLAVLVTLIAGKFDLSVAAMATLTCFLSVGLAINQRWPFALVLVVCILVGLAGGALNGLLVVKLRVNAFIATLGTGGVFDGLSAVYSHGTQVTPGVGTGQLPTWFSGPGSLGSVESKFPVIPIWIGLVVAAAFCFLSLRRRRPERVSPRQWDAITIAGLVVVAAVLLILGLSSWVHAVSWTIAVLAIAALLLWLLLDFTTYGRYLRAVGSNAAAASLAGVNPGKETVKAFMIGGVLAAVAGILLGASQGTASPGGADTFLLPAFAAAFLSTVVLSTGRFHVWGTLIGGGFLVWVSEGLIVGGLAFTWTQVVNGVVLVIAVAFSSVFRRTTT
jgi:ribose/xylose/arabinose/galactoside ABC-type transport system permease subunit